MNTTYEIWACDCEANEELLTITESLNKAQQLVKMYLEDGYQNLTIEKVEDDEQYEDVE
jgi:hypothetical protein